eukprot:GEMP01023723.1.p1 GENE.GEMP01023723.1~~GEMP01023723.1.p1  ORF type:complete len:412 (+),score=110.59 GEMP01023723.1:154-1389(+)
MDTPAFGTTDAGSRKNDALRYRAATIPASATIAPMGFRRRAASLDAQFGPNAPAAVLSTPADARTAPSVREAGAHHTGTPNADPRLARFGAEPISQAPIPGMLNLQSLRSDADPQVPRFGAEPISQGVPMYPPSITPQESDPPAYSTFLADKVDIKPGVSRTIIKLPRAKVPGAPEFLDGMHRQTSFAPVESNVTFGPRASLVAEEGLSKSWYNTYTYTYASRGEDFSARFKSTSLENDPTPTYIDHERAQKRSAYLAQRLRDDAEEERRDADVEQGRSCVLQPYVMDAYTGQEMVVISGQFRPRDMEKDLKMNRTDWDRLIDPIRAGTSFDNLRLPWPMEKADNDKRIDMRAYEWFDRGNPYIAKDSDFQFIQTASCYADPVEHAKWRVRGGDSIWDQVLDVVDHAFSVD